MNKCFISPVITVLSSTRVQLWQISCNTCSTFLFKFTSKTQL